MYLFRQRGRLTWQLRWWDGGRKRQVSTGTTDRAQAERVLATMRAAQDGRDSRRAIERLLTAMYGAGAGARVSLEAAIDEYLQAAPDTQRTRLVARYWQALVAWVRANREGISDLADIDAATCRAYAAALAQSGAAPGTQSNRIAACSVVYRQVAPLHGIDGDPWRGIGKSRRGVEEKRAITADEFRRLLAATAGTEYYGACLVAWYTGLRYGDCARLRWESIAGGVIDTAPAKTAARGIRIRVPLHPVLAKYLDGLPGAGAGAAGFVFPELARTYNTRTASNHAAQYRRAAGLPANITFHAIRHAFVSRLHAAGVPEDVRRRLVGHTSARTHDGYTHGLEQERRAVEGLE